MDADEFAVLPPGVTTGEVIASLERRGSASVWGVMVDVYPRDPAALRDNVQDLSHIAGRGGSFQDS